MRGRGRYRACGSPFQPDRPIGRPREPGRRLRRCAPHRIDDQNHRGRRHVRGERVLPPLPRLCGRLGSASLRSGPGVGLVRPTGSGSPHFVRWTGRRRHGHGPGGRSHRWRRSGDRRSARNRPYHSTECRDGRTAGRDPNHRPCGGRLPVRHNRHPSARVGRQQRQSGLRPGVLLSGDCHCRPQRSGSVPRARCTPAPQCHFDGAGPASGLDPRGPWPPGAQLECYHVRHSERLAQRRRGGRAGRRRGHDRFGCPGGSDPRRDRGGRRLLHRRRRGLPAARVCGTQRRRGRAGPVVAAGLHCGQDEPGGLGSRHLASIRHLEPCPAARLAAPHTAPRPGSGDDRGRDSWVAGRRRLRGSIDSGPPGPSRPAPARVRRRDRPVARLLRSAASDRHALPQRGRQDRRGRAAPLGGRFIPSLEGPSGRGCDDSRSVGA